MSISGLTTSYIPASLDGLNVIDADQIYIDGQLVNLTDYVPYQGANRTIDAGGQNIQTTHTATATNDVVNKGLLDTTISNLAISIAGSFLDKVSVTPQTVIGNVSYTAQLSADDLLVPATKKATLGSVLSIDANYTTPATDAGVITRQYFGSITSSMGIYEATSTQNFAILQCADLGTGTGKRMDINWNLNINEASYNSSIQLFSSSDGVTTNQYLGPSVSFTPSDPLYKVMTGTFVPQYRYLCVLCITSKPGGVQTVRWYGLNIEEQGIELTNVTMPSLTADRVPVLNGNKQLVSSGISTTTLEYIAHLSSDAQSQLNGKLNLSGSNANQNIVLGTYRVQSSATPSIGDDYTNKTYVDTAITGLASTYAKLAGPQTFTGTHTFSNVSPITLSGLMANRLLGLSVAGNIQAVSVTLLEASYLSGVTSSLQTQINTLSGTFANYLPLTGGTLSGNLTVEGASGISLTNVATTNGFLSTRYYIGARGDNQDDVGTDNKWGPWYGLGESGIPDFTGVPCLAGYAGVALRTSTGIFIMKDDGAVGIGTTNVIGRHNIAYLGSADFQTLQNTNYSANQFINQRFMFGKNNASNSSAYVQASLNANEETDLLFYVYGSGLNERLRIKGNGNIYANASVGIGESAPSAPLHVKASGGSNPSANGIYVFNSTNSAGQDAIVSVRVAGTSGGNPYISFDVANEAGWAWGMDNADNSMKLSNSWSSLTSATKMTINSLGRVGIGTASPNAALHVYQNTNGGTRSYVVNPNSGSGSYALFAVINNTGSGCVLFQNSNTRTEDGGVNAATLRNDIGTLRVQAQYGLGLTIDNDGCVKANCGTVSSTNPGSANMAAYFGIVRGDARNSAGLWTGIDTGNNVWQLSLRPDISWNGWNGRAASYTWYVSNGPTNGSLLINNNGAVNVAGNSAHAVPNGYMSRGSLTIGSIDANYGWGYQWTGNTAGLLLECADLTEIAVHDAGHRVASMIAYAGGAGRNWLVLGRDMGWGSSYVTTASTFSVAGDSSYGRMNIYNPDGSFTHWGTSERVNYVRGGKTLFDTTTDTYWHLNWYYDAYSPGAHLHNSPGTWAVSIWATGAIVTNYWFGTVSDQRIKKNIKSVGSMMDVIKRIEVVSFDFIDSNHKRDECGIIAQQVEEVFPNIVDKSVGVIPNILKRASSYEKGEGTLKVFYPRQATDELEVGSRVKLMFGIVGVTEADSKKKGEYTEKVLRIASDSIVVEWTSPDDVSDLSLIVYGKEVDDFRNVDKEQLGVMAIKGVQELSQQMDVIVQRNIVLETWARDQEAKQKEQEAKMAKMEANIEKMASLLAQLISKQ